jgi:hypothetical protein
MAEGIINIVEEIRWDHATSYIVCLVLLVKQVPKWIIGRSQLLWKCLCVV